MAVDPRYADFLNEGTNLLPRAPVVADPNDQPNPANPGGLSNNDLWRNHDFGVAQARATGNTNQGTPGGIGSPAAAAAQQGNAPVLTTGQIPGASYQQRGGQTVQVNRQTPAQAMAYNQQLLHIDDLGLAPRQNVGRNIAGATAAGAAGGSVLGPVGTGVGAAAGLLGGTVSNLGARADQLGSTALSDQELAQMGITDPRDVAEYRSRHGAPASTGTAAAPVRGGNPGGAVNSAPGFEIGPNGLPVAGSGNGAGAPAGAAPPALAASYGQGLGDKILGMADGSRRTDTVNKDVMAYLDAERNQKGPSEAEALLHKIVDRNAAAALGVAATARGGAGARERAQRLAITTNASNAATSTQDLAALRAKEDAARRDRIIQLYNSAGQNAAAGDRTDQGYVNAASNLYGSSIQAQSTADTNASRTAEGAADRASRSTESAADRANRLQIAQIVDPIRAQDLALRERQYNDSQPEWWESAIQYGPKIVKGFAS